MKWKLMRIRGMGDVLADMIVQSGLSMRSLAFSSVYIRLAFNGCDSKMAEIIRAAATKYSQCEPEVNMIELAKVQNSSPSLSRLLAIGLSTVEAEIVLAAYPNWDKLAFETPIDLINFFDFAPRSAVAVVALSRMICLTPGSPDKLEAYLEKK